MTEYDTMLDEFDFSGSMGAQVAKDANKGGDFQRELEFLRLDASQEGVRAGKDQAVIRLVTEYERKIDGPPTRWTLPWITVAQHYAPTKPKPPYSREQQTWPSKMFAVCRRDKVFTKRYNGQCPVCDQGNKAGDRTWALAVEREQVIDEETRRIIGFRDKMREVLVFDDNNEPVVVSQEGDKKTYAKKWVPAYLILNFGWKNFFNPLNGQASYWQSVLGRDFLVKRDGMGNNDTNYTFIPMDPITLQGDNPWGVAAGTPYDLGLIVGEDNGRPVTLAERVYPDLPDLRRIVLDRTTDDYHGRWFVPGWLPKGFDPAKAAQSSQQPQGYMGGFQPAGGVQQGSWGQPQNQNQTQTGYQPAAAQAQPQNQSWGQSPQFQQPGQQQAQGYQQQGYQQQPNQAPQQAQQQPQGAPQGYQQPQGPVTPASAPEAAQEASPESLEALRARVTSQQGQGQPSQ